MRTEDYVALDFKDNTVLDAPSRREFLKRLGGGIVILVSLGDWALAQEGGRQRGGRPSTPADFNAFLRIAEDGHVTCFTGKIEMGQGPITSLPQMLAEEMDTPLETVDIIMGDTDRCPWDMGTFGSMTTRMFGPALQAAAAEARAVLLELAAEALKVPQAQLVAKDGAVFDAQDKDKRITYGQLAKGQKIERHVKVKPALKDCSAHTVVGKPLVRRDGRDKVTGKAKFAGDIREPGMLYAKLLRPPAHGAKLKSVDASGAKAIAGVQVVQEGDLVAVLHELPDVAEAALEKVKAEFEVPEPTVDDKSIFDHLLKSSPQGRPVAEGGDLAAGRKLASKAFEQTYYNSYVAHAAMETHTALAKVAEGKATVWASTQNPFGAQREIAEATGLPAKDVRVIAPFVGGGFGGKTRNTQAVEAARLSKAIGKPVQVMWSRAEEFFYDTFRPAAVVKINSGVDPTGRISFWDYDVLYAGERGAKQFYDVPDHRTVARPSGWQGPAGAQPLATGAWRAPGNNTNTFARESQIDIMAAAAGMDPVEFRLKNLTDPKMIRVLKAAAERFGWTPAKAPSKRGYGVACGTDAGSCVATIVEADVDTRKGTVQVKRVVCAQDMGLVVNPEGAKMQVEGCSTMGLGYALTEEVHFNGGKVLETNFDTYELPRFSWVPKIETVLIDAKDSPPQGGGKPAIIVMGAVVANAIFDRTGARLLQLPMTPERVLAAIART